MNDTKRSSIMGDEPKLALYLLPALAVALAAGIELAVFGLAFQASSAFELIRAYRAGKLAMRGSFALCRNPIFSWWIFSVLPSLALMLNSWLPIAVAVLFRALSGRLAKEEEAELGALFGKEYWRYRARVRPFLPLPYFKPFRPKRYLKTALFLAVIGTAAIAVFATIQQPAMLWGIKRRAERTFAGELL